MCFLKSLMAMGASAALLLSAQRVHAEGRTLVDWGRILVELDAAARGARANGPSAREAPRMVAPRIDTPAAWNARTSQPLEGASGTAWFGVAPRVSIVARDWGATYRLSGDRLGVVDAMRLTESTRMVVGRFRASGLSHARVVPFAQIGAGQWRTDPKLLPLTPRSIEIAAQVGAGVEVAVTRNLELAWETSAIMLVRESREAGDVPQTRVFSATMAARMYF